MTEFKLYETSLIQHREVTIKVWAANENEAREIAEANVYHHDNASDGDFEFNSTWEVENGVIEDADEVSEDYEDDDEDEDEDYDRYDEEDEDE